MKFVAGKAPTGRARASRATGVTPAASRIAAAFERARAAGRAAFIPYVTAGDPSLAATAEIVRRAPAAGADLLELGVPFSDPIADGPVNQRAAERALAAGATLAGVLELAAAARREGSELPLVLFSYFNPIHRMGIGAFARRAAAAGIDGVLVTDLPPEEADELAPALMSQGIDPIFLLAPTSGADRIAAVARRARGFVYYVSRTGVTGAQVEFERGLSAAVTRVRRATDFPVAVGFGISTEQQVRQAAGVADGVVVGSAIVAVLETRGVAAALALMRELAAGVRVRTPGPDSGSSPPRRGARGRTAWR